MRRQDRNPDPEQADAWRSLLPSSITIDDLILAGALASQAANNDTVDHAVIGGLKDKQALKPYQVTHFTPFDPVHKRTEATVKGADGKTFKVTKGAPQVILALSANAEGGEGCRR